MTHRDAKHLHERGKDAKEVSFINFSIEITIGFSQKNIYDAPLIEVNQKEKKIERNAWLGPEQFNYQWMQTVKKGTKIERSRA